MPLWMAIFNASHQHLLDSAEARTYLVDERGLHPQVLIDSMIGVVPPDLDVTQLFVPMFEAAETELERSRATAQAGQAHEEGARGHRHWRPTELRG